MTAPIHPAIDGRASGVLPYPSMQPALREIHSSEIVPDPGTWVLTEEQVPESNPHEILSEHLKHLLLWRAKEAGWNVHIGRNIAFRWDAKHPQYGLDPDVYMVEPPPPEGAELMSLLLWQPGHVAPKLAVEIVSPGHPTKDYVIAPEKYAVSGVGELWILDARLEGPSKKGGPYAIQVWRRQEEGLFAQVYAGAGPAWSPAVQGFIQFLEDGARYALSTDREGVERWLTEKEAAQRQAQADRAAREAAQQQAQAAQRQTATERAAREAAEQQVKAAERRIQELEALLARGR